ncbi:MAG: hypothetical protein PVG22_12780, partial [Chromatiales bacterium]
PARAAENIPLDRVLTALRRSDQRIPIEQTAAPFEQAMDQVFNALEQATTQRLQGLTLRDLILQTELLQQSIRAAPDA